LCRRRNSQNPGKSVAGEDYRHRRAQVLTKDAWPFANVEILPIHGTPKFNEVVFYFKPQKTLIVTDLVFNLQKPLPFLHSLPFRTMGTYRKTNVSRLLKFLTKDRSGVSHSLKQVLQLDFNRLIMAHGEVISENAKPIFEKITLKHLV
jgi:hypothetical protein